MLNLSRIALLTGFCAVSLVYGDTVNLVTTPAALGANDTVAWAQLGIDGTTIPQSFSATSSGGKMVGGALTTNTGIVATACNGCSWSPLLGAFVANTPVVWAYNSSFNTGSGPVTFTFPSGAGAGAIVQSDAPGAFTARLELFNGSTSLGFVTETSNASGDAMFIGALDVTGPNVTKAVFSLTSAPSDSNVATFLGDFAVGPLSLNVAAAAPPSVTSVSPINSTGTPQTFTVVYTDPAGVADLNGAHLLFNASLNSAGACWAAYVPSTNTVFLINDAGTGFAAGSFTPGGAGSASNSQCTISSGGAKSTTATTLTLPIAIAFAANFKGAKNVYGFASGTDGLNSGWTLKGTWTPAAAVAPVPTSVTPINSSGTTSTFTAVYTDSAGSADVNATQLLFNAGLNGAGACWIYYVPVGNTAYLINDAGTGIAGSFSPGSAGSASNSQCTIGNAGVVTTSAGTLSLPVAVTFTAAFTGSKNVYGLVSGYDGLSSAWTLMGTWTPSNPSGPPVVTSITPVNGTGLTQTFTSVYTDPVGNADIGYGLLLFNAGLTSGGGCYTEYVRSSNTVFLINDAGTGFAAGSFTPGGAGSATNSQCTISNGGAVTTTATTLSIPIAITFKPAFTGTKSVYGYALGNDSLNSGWTLKGTWIP